MHTYGMTEEKAKHILDFLARNAGYCKMSIRRKYGPDKSRQFVIVCKRKLEPDDMLYDDDYLLYAANRLWPHLLVISIESKSYANALKTIFKLSRDGKDIFCSNSLVLSARTSLEEILIEMDLKDEFYRRTSKKNSRLSC